MIREFNVISGNYEKEVDPVLEAKMLREEIDEYLQACIENDNHEIIDALADIYFVLWGTITKHSLGTKFKEYLQEVCDSNMSKFCKTFEEAQASQKEYQKEGKKVLITMTDPHYYILRTPEGKVMKSINFKKPKFNL